MKESFTWKLVRSLLRWAGHVERMERLRLTKIADALGVEGRRRRGMRWEDCVERDLVGLGGEWRTKARDRGSGDGSKTELVMKKKRKHKSTTGIGASLIPDYSEKEESND